MKFYVDKGGLVFPFFFFLSPLCLLKSGGALSSGLWLTVNCSSYFIGPRLYLFRVLTPARET